VRASILRLASLLPLVALVATVPAAPALARQAADAPILPAAVRAAADGIDAARLARDLEYLSSDALLGRNTPSPGFDSAAVYIARRLEAAGVRPLGDDGGWFQYYDLREESIDTAAAWIEIGGRRFRFGEDFVMRSFAGPLTGELPVVYVGHGYTVPGHDIDPYRDVDVRGKLVLVHGPPAVPPGVELQQIGRLTVNAGTPFVEAEQRGAAGILFIAGEPSLNGWSLLRRANTTRLELHPIVPSAYAALPVTSALLQPELIDALLAGERVDGAAMRERAEARDYGASFQLDRTVTVNIPLASSATHRPYNVVAMIEGSDPVLRHQYIVIESHLDGAVGRAALDGDSIYNAADDNATGSAANLAIAEQMMRAPRPKRSIIFIWDSGEERGLWGTRHFVNSPPVPFDSIVALVNIDMIGANRAPGSADENSPDVTGPNEVYLTGPGVLSAQVDARLERVNREYRNTVFNRAFDRPDHEFFYPRTDAGPFLERGVLTIGYFTGLHRRYHRPNDEAQYLDPTKMEAIARTIFAGVWALADQTERPGIDRGIPPTVPRYR
jgi:hypothetical protein